MGRRKNNPDLVHELIEGRLDMDGAEWNAKYDTLSKSDMELVDDGVDYRYQYDPQFDGDEDDAESLSASDAALIWMSNGKDEDYMFGYDEDELEAACQ